MSIIVDVVKYETKGNMGKITLNKPEQQNSFDLITLSKLIERFEESAKNGDICVLFTAEGKRKIEKRIISSRGITFLIILELIFQNIFSTCILLTY